MKITKSWLVEHRACKQGIKVFMNQKETDSIKILKLLIRSKEKENLKWADWLISKLFKTKKQKVQYAVYSARLVLPVFEQEYPGDLRPRKAIKAVENWLKNPSKKNREVCKEASSSASSAASAAYAASYDATSAHYAAYAADAAYSAVYASYDAACTAYAAPDNKIFTEILKYGITLLNKKDK